jgi:hypothetical protein
MYIILFSFFFINDTLNSARLGYSSNLTDDQVFTNRNHVIENRTSISAPNEKEEVLCMKNIRGLKLKFIFK